MQQEAELILKTTYVYVTTRIKIFNVTSLQDYVLGSGIKIEHSNILLVEQSQVWSSGAKKLQCSSNETV
jgi:hypothetical protein